MENRRRHTRFSATAFLNKPVTLTPLPPFFGRALKGKLIDLSAGGMAILINEIIPQGTNLSLVATFPDGFKVECFVQIRHVLPRNRTYLHGIEFINLPAAVRDKIERMSGDYINCESRIHSGITDVCHSDCAFFTMCTKREKINPLLQPQSNLALTFQTLDKFPFKNATHF